PESVALAGAVGLGCAAAFAFFRPPAPAPAVVYCARDSIRVMRERPRLGRVALAQGFYGGGIIAAGPLFALVNVGRLDMSMADVGIIGVLGAIATTLSYIAWGVVADR